MFKEWVIIIICFWLDKGVIIGHELFKLLNEKLNRVEKLDREI